jgi:polyisoprenoid-binding protein YceI
MRRAMFALAVLIFSGLASAAGPPPGTADIARVQAGTYRADPAHTLVAWRVNHMGFNDYFGLFGTIAGTLVIDPANPAAAKVAVRIPLRKVTTANAGLTGHLLRPSTTGKPDYFGPQPADALFTSTRVIPAADGTAARIEGRLTLNGVTRPVTLEARFTGAGKNPLGGKLTLGFEASTTINRSEFGLSSDIPLVGDAVALDISAAFELQK